MLYISTKKKLFSSNDIKEYMSNFKLLDKHHGHRALGQCHVKFIRK